MRNLVEDRQQLVGGTGDAMVAVSHTRGVVAREIADDILTAGLQVGPALDIVAVTELNRIAAVRPSDGAVLFQLSLPGLVSSLAWVDADRICALVGDCILALRCRFP